MLSFPAFPLCLHLNSLPPQLPTSHHESLCAILHFTTFRCISVHLNAFQCISVHFSVFQCALYYTLRALEFIVTWRSLMRISAQWRRSRISPDPCNVTRLCSQMHAARLALPPPLLHHNVTESNHGSRNHSPDQTKSLQVALIIVRCIAHK